MEDHRVMAVNRRELGRQGEEYACEILINEGLEIIERNFRCPKGEVDIIARDGHTLVFVEVRTRRSGFRGWGEESITSEKAQRLQAIAGYYLVSKKFRSWPPMRFDVLAIRWTDEKREYHWVKAAF